MALFGQIKEFIPSQGNINDYLERLDFYLEANNVTEEAKKRAVLLTVIGQQQFRLLKDLAAPSKPGDKTFAQLRKLLKDHHEPPPPKFLQRAKFEARVRGTDETIAQFVAALRNLSEYCEFGDTLNDRLCEKFVTGVNDQTIQRKLLLERNLTLDKAVNLAQSIQQTSEGARALERDKPASINALSRRGPPQSHQPQKNSFGRQVTAKSTGNRHKNDRPTKDCHRCLGPHASKDCKFKSATCYKCEKPGHIAKACFTGNSHTATRAGDRHKSRYHHNHYVSAEADNDPDPEETFHLFTLSTNKKTPPVSVTMNINKEPVHLQVDTGASLTVMTKKDFEHYIAIPLQQSSKKLQTYTGQSVPIIGECMVSVGYNNQNIELPLTVVEGDGPPLLGRNWLSHLKLDWHSIFAVSLPMTSQDNLNLDNVLSANSEAFGDSGLLKEKKVNINMKENSVPKYCKARSPPFAMREKIENELKRLESNGIITKVDNSEWATPIVPVLKKDNTVRICGDYKITINQQVEENKYPIPLIEEIALKLAGGEKFTELDFSHAYTQLELHPDSKHFTTINTHKGLFQYNRLCFGISASPGIFQSIMDSLFQDIPNVCVYFDNVYVTGKNDNDHLQTLNNVLKLIKEKGLKVNQSKCQFMQNEINFLGYKLNKNGLQPQEEKVKAIKEAPTPENTHQLKSFLGMINYYSKFIGNLSQTLAPLYKLLRKEENWQWGREQEQAFQKAKEILSSQKLLIHFDPSKKLVLTCDASPDGVGAVLSHTDSSGERPIAYASRSLNKAERNYSQLDREALALVFGVRKFHKFVFGKKITLITDHKPLLGLFGEQKPLPENASPRVQRWAITLAAYSYQLVYRPGNQNNADALSRLPLLEYTQEYVPDDIHVLFNVIDTSGVNVDDVVRETKADECLSKVYEYCMKGWPENVEERLGPYKKRMNELSIENGCILWSHRVIIPYALQNDVLKMLHDAHVGTSKMRSLARAWLWWPHLDADIEKFVKLCNSCQKHAKHPAKAPLHNWDWPTEPWKRIHVDFAGPFINKMFLIVIDSHSKWLEVKQMNTITTSDTIIELKEIFSYHGLPDQIVSDNGPSFTSHEFKLFCGANGIEHITTSPYHPAGNGLAEKAVGTFKTAMIKLGSSSKLSLREKINSFLTKYRITPHITTGVAPCELLCGRKLKTHIDLLHPTVQNSVFKHQQTQKVHHDRHAIDREINVDDSVFIKNWGKGEKWVPGQVVQCTGPVSYKVRTEDSVISRRHQDQIRVTCAENTCGSTSPSKTGRSTLITSADQVMTELTGQKHQISNPDIPVTPPYEVSKNVKDSLPLPTNGMANEASVPPVQSTLRRSSRTVKAPDKLNL